jgi:class 3 adenylate cyclase
MGTVVAVGVIDSEDDVDEQRSAELLAAAARLADDLAEERGIERITSAANSFLFVVDSDTGDDGGPAALSFGTDLRARLLLLAETEGGLLTVSVGLSTGPVGTGVLHTGGPTFGAWGEPVRRALALTAVSSGDSVMADSATIAAASGSGWSFEAATDLVDLGGEPMDAFRASSVDDVATSDHGA